MPPKVFRQEDFLPFTEALFDREEQARKADPTEISRKQARKLMRKETSFPYP